MAASELVGKCSSRSAIWRSSVGSHATDLAAVWMVTAKRSRGVVVIAPPVQNGRCRAEPGDRQR